MHQHCLSCSAALGVNESVEIFPLGRRLAFDAWKGRLWVVCPSCRRWNLAPIEERWEPVEALEKLFRDSRSRVQAENIGLARLRDGTTLVRIGSALEGELAAWRNGEELRKRRWRGILGSVAVIVGGGAVMLGLQSAAFAIGAPSAFMAVWMGGNLALQYKLQRRPVHRVPAEVSPTGNPLVVRRMHLLGAVLSQTTAGEASLLLPLALERRPWKVFKTSIGWRGHLGISELADCPPLELTGAAVRRVTGRTLVSSNAYGASTDCVRQALALLETAGGSRAFIDSIAAAGWPLPIRPPGALLSRDPFRPHWLDDEGDLKRLPPALQRQFTGESRGLDRIQSVALEMAVHEERERRALEGELQQLKDEWQEAEMLAGIADALPDEPLPALPER